MASCSFLVEFVIAVVRVKECVCVSVFVFFFVLVRVLVIGALSNFEGHPRDLCTGGGWRRVPASPPWYSFRFPACVGARFSDFFPRPSLDISALKVSRRQGPDSQQAQPAHPAQSAWLAQTSQFMVKRTIPRDDHHPNPQRRGAAHASTRGEHPNRPTQQACVTMRGVVAWLGARGAYIAINSDKRKRKREECLGVGWLIILVCPTRLALP